jgi:hypothetical protein
VAVKLHHVLPGVAVRPAKKDGKGLVGHTAGAVQHLAQHHAPGRARPKGLAAQRAENLCGAKDRALSGQTDDPHGGLDRAGGNGGDQVFHTPTPFRKICVIFCS